MAVSAQKGLSKKTFDHKFTKNWRPRIDMECNQLLYIVTYPVFVVAYTN